MTMQQYCLKWNNHQPNFISVFSSLLNSESLVDVTLSAEGRHLQAHKLVLSACSSYFQSLFTINPCQHPIVILKDVKFTDLKVMVDFMYYGEVNVSQEQLPHILKTAEMLKIKGLAEVPVEPSISRHNNSLDRTELLTANESNWGSEGQRQSMTPSPCPLSPSTRRKRLRKSSTGSGSGSTERNSEELITNDITITSPSAPPGSVIKPDPGGFPSEVSTSQKCKQASTDSEAHRSSSHDSGESEPSHQITLQIPQQQDINISHSIESGTSIDIPGPSSSSSQTVSGFQWGIVDHGYPGHFASCQPNMSVHNDLPYTPNSHMSSPNHHPLDQKPNPPHQITNSPPQIMQKRKRNLNPQADENFVRALEAVRFGGIGFCKAARMYGVNNRTLWLEYKKRGYPISRLSIKNRKPENGNQPQNQHPQPPPPQQPQPQPPPSQSQPQPPHQPPQPQIQTSVSSNVHHENDVVNSSNNPIAMISSAFLEGRPVELAPVFQRSRFFDNGIINGQPMNLQGINFEPM